MRIVRVSSLFETNLCFSVSLSAVFRFSHLIGFGQCVMHLLRFSGCLAQETQQNRLQLSHWETLVDSFFTDYAVMRLTLWKDNQRAEAKPFEIGVPILPRFFLVTAQSGVKSMSFTLEGARERVTTPGRATIDCAGAVWAFRYTSGYTVTLRGTLTARLSVQPPKDDAPQPFPGLKFEEIIFDASTHEKLISLDAIQGPRRGPVDSPRSPIMNGPTYNMEKDENRVHIDRAVIPGEPVNAFGIPQATMRCLEVGTFFPAVVRRRETNMIDSLQKAWHR
ncbi:hypothetical protein CERSUDRAFT_43527 [Gelatoporia subvermispora B]|uniref:Uncharacterized protein n=1 Tax=Ceriporiopsis subvermispora (strain B) TaxID=914234 RepID=M2R9Q4_CERS8|nr:hypothetical protein CERSUDRAFT_43527 [Gelatoporia subvermispora B]